MQRRRSGQCDRGRGPTSALTRRDEGLTVSGNVAKMKYAGRILWPRVAWLVAASLVMGAHGTLAQPAAWEAVGPAPPAVEAPVAVGPAGSGLIYIGTFGGGVLKSRDEGHTFQSVNNGLTNLAVTAMVVDPTSTDVVYVATFGTGIFTESRHPVRGRWQRGVQEDDHKTTTTAVTRPYLLACRADTRVKAGATSE